MTHSYIKHKDFYGFYPKGSKELVSLTKDNDVSRGKFWYTIKLYKDYIYLESLNKEIKMEGILRFYDYDNEAILTDWIEIIKPTMEDIKKLNEYIKNHKDFHEYFVVGVRNEGNIIIYKKLSQDKRSAVVKFIQLLKDTKTIKPFFDRGKKNINQQIHDYQQLNAVKTTNEEKKLTTIIKEKASNIKNKIINTFKKK